MANLCVPVTVSSSFTGVSKTTTSCDAMPGVKEAYVAARTDLDLTTMSLGANLSTTNDCPKILNFVMLSAGVFKLVANDGGSTTYTRVKQGGNYLHTLTLQFKGRSADRDCQLNQLKNLLCDAVIVVVYNDCYKEVIGLDVSISGGVGTLSSNNKTFTVTEDNIDALTEDATEFPTHTVTITMIGGKGINVTATTIPT